jgi:hypothetical protein
VARGRILNTCDIEMAWKSGVFLLLPVIYPALAVAPSCF